MVKVSDDKHIDAMEFDDSALWASWQDDNIIQNDNHSD